MIILMRPRYFFNHHSGSTQLKEYQSYYFLKTESYENTESVGPHFHSVAFKRVVKVSFVIIDVVQPGQDNSVIDCLTAPACLNAQ